ncbi:DHH family phosphoesterase [Sunxiuqinia indica]|uniref:DHH family phosphoesterase n=1 Tax=Sunxiuqinia indica TaxID=2692584 RepID=UPI001359A443|nr:bifunctional oligoribonuclease/PAP phosphatase NrnA [Sunxiuqinia indica]
MKELKLDLINAFKELIVEPNQRVVILPHVNPDGDAIGSALGMAHILKTSGLQVNVVCVNEYADFFKWMDDQESVTFYSSDPKKVEQLLDDSDLLICLDFNHLSRTGKMKELIENYSKSTVLIDHHPYPQDFADIIISHPECSSTAELVFHVIRALDFEQYMNKSAAECLFCGIMTDTGSFDYNVSDPQTFQTVGELLKFGIDQDYIHSQVFDNYSADRMRLLGYCLNECMEVFPEHHAAVIYLTKETQAKFNFVKGDSEGFVNYPLSIRGIHFSTLFSEKDGMVKASFRSKGEFAVNEFASENFNGGGHCNAAGGEIYASLTETLDKYRKLLPVYQEKLVKTKS